MGLSSDNIAYLRHVETVSSCMATIPFSIAGIAMALAISSHRRQLRRLAQSLNKESLATLEGKTSAEVHQLIDSALRLGHVEAADKISQYLLRQNWVQGE